MSIGRKVIRGTAATFANCSPLNFFLKLSSSFSSG